MAPMYLGFLGFIGDGHDIAWFVLPYIAAVALLMVSRVPTFSGKMLGGRISRDLVLPILGIAALAIVSLIAFTWHVLTAMSLLYIAMIPVGIRSYRRHKAEWEKRTTTQESESEDEKARERP
jgi:CDP-diacylglycerol--serine O-phosphatidyltransferase